MDFDKNELHALKYINSYKSISIICMIFGGLGVPFGIYNHITQPKPYAGVYLNNALIGASISMIGMGYLLYCFVILTKSLKEKLLKCGYKI